MKARPLLASLEVADIIQRDPGGAGELLLRPASLGPESSESFAEHDCLRRLSP